MGIPHALCTSLRNGTRARLRYVAVPSTPLNLSMCSILLRHGYLASVTLGSASSPSPLEYHTASPKEQRIWAEMKYRLHRPVLGDLQLISKPSKKIWLDAKELEVLLSGRMVQYVKPMNVGEIAIVDTETTELGLLEAREAVHLGIGGKLVARATP